MRTDMTKLTVASRNFVNAPKRGGKKKKKNEENEKKYSARKYIKNSTRQQPTPAD